MAEFNSDVHKVLTSPASLMAFLAKPVHLIQILPADRIENWKSDGDQCSFKIKGLADISLSLDSQSDAEVIYKSNSNKPFPFKLIIKAEGENDSTLHATFDADVNGFMATMLKAPLTNFLNSLGESLTVKFA